MNRHASWLAGVLCAALGLPLAGRAEIQEWPSYNHDPASQRYSPLAQIHPGNVGGLHRLCTYDTGETTGFQTGLVQTAGALFGTTAHDTFSLDPNTCKVNWRRHEDFPPSLSSLVFQVNRGVAYLDGRVFRGTLHGDVLAYDARTGERLWSTPIANPAAGEFVDAAPLAWNGLVFIGNASGDVKGVKGHVYALDARDGHIVWEFFLVPREEGDPVRGPLAADPHAAAIAASWGNRPGFPISGGGSWTSYSLDPQEGVLFVPVSNPSPDTNKEVRPGDNLYTNSVLALDARTGAYRHHYQLIPADFHDWGVSSAPVLLATRGGARLIAETPKDGNLYAIDRSNYSLRYKTPQTTIYQAEAPIVSSGTRFCPGLRGGSEWNGPSYHPGLNLIFSGQTDWCSTINRASDETLLSEWIGWPWIGDALSLLGQFDAPIFWSGWVNATDADSGTPTWRFKAPTPIVSGVTSTGGGLLLFGDLNGTFYVFDAARGKPLWRQALDGALAGGVITYDTGAGQRIAVASGFTSLNYLPAILPNVTAKVVVYGL